ncbi:MAG: ABC transporter ATP-binding protein [Chloroflexota bacterium]
MSVHLNPEPSPFDQPIIQAEQVVKTYRTGHIEVQALRQVNLSIQKGEMVAIMGPSGCGKTTLLNCLSGLDDFDAGEVQIEGQSLRRMGDRRRTTYRAQRMGFIFQTFNLLPVLSAVENVELPLLVSGTAPGKARKQSLEALEQVGLGDRSTHRPAELSGGQRQRVTIARALVNDPAIIWADEPTGNLDSKTTADILSIMRQLNQEQERTFVIVTHTTEVSDWCDRIITMSDGEVVDDGKGMAAQFEQAERRRERETASAAPTNAQIESPVHASTDMINDVTTDVTADATANVQEG